MKSGIITAVVLAMTVGIIAGLWSYFEDHKLENKEKVKVEINEVYPYHDVVFAGVIFLATFCALTIACFNGTLTPMVATSFGLDPAKTAGPFETALQDVFGQTILVGASYLIFMYTEPEFW